VGTRIFIFGEDGFTNIVLANSLSMLGIDVLGEVDNEVIALRQITHHCPDVAVLQVDLGHVKAISLAKTLRKNFPNLGIVIATKTTDIRLIGIERKDLPIGVLVSQISKHNDLDNLKFDIEQAPNCTTCKPDFHICDYLSDVQVETFRLMAQGNANSEIAKVRYVSEKSVEQMLARISLSLGLVFDHKFNSRVRLMNSYYELVNGRK
jgi:DNA-binding NarL/FixJ family response regulator